MGGFSEICMNKQCITVMKVEKSYYESPVTWVIHVRTEGFVCVSNYMKFGSGNSSGSIDDEDVYDGGNF